MIRTRQIYGAVLLSALLTATALRASTLEASAEQSPGATSALQGTWLVQVTGLSDCVTRNRVGSFFSMLTFAADGTMIGTTANPAFAPGQRGPDHGVWASISGAARFRASSLALISFATPPNPPASPGFQTGGQTLVQTISVAGNSFTSDATSTFFDNAAQPYRSICATAVGQRWQ